MLPNAEKKWKDTDITCLPNNAAANNFSLAAMVVGSAAQTRVGTRIAISSVELRFAIDYAPCLAPDIVRYALLVDHQANATQAGITDYWTTASVASLKALVNRSRFTCLLDKTYSTVIVTETARKPVLVHKFIKFQKPLIIDYNAANNGTYADIAKNNLFLTFLGSDAAGDGAHIIGLARIRYVDY